MKYRRGVPASTSILFFEHRLCLADAISDAGHAVFGCKTAQHAALWQRHWRVEAGAHNLGTLGQLRVARRSVDKAVGLVVVEAVERSPQLFHLQLALARHHVGGWLVTPHGANARVLWQRSDVVGVAVRDAN